MTDLAKRRSRREDVAVRAARDLFGAVLGDDSPVRVTLPDGSVVGPADAALVVHVRSTDALAHLVRSPGELGLARAYVSRAIDIEGDIGLAVALRDRVRSARVVNRHAAELVAALGPDLVRNPLPRPSEEIDGHQNPLTRHSRRRDAESISHHYDVSNEFYRLVLGPSMTYSCAVFGNDTESLEQAQQNKVELVCRKLALEPGMRLLDVGCGWGAMAIHAAKHHRVRVVGVTISQQQYEHARNAARSAGVDELVEIRLQDYRDIADGPFDAISSIGMFEHVGLARTGEYFGRLRDLLRDEGRLLNHQIGRPPTGNKRFGRERTAVDPRGFIHRYVFPDGELLEVGQLVNAMQEAGFEVRHLESLREHYARTLAAWGANLDAHWAEAAALVGEGRTRVWKLYMAASAVMFRTNRLQVHQVLGVHTPSSGRSAMPWRVDWDADLHLAGRATTGDGAQPDGRAPVQVIDLRDRADRSTRSGG